jgi:putative DNA-invertase from lambdoid prophage Rac
VNTLAELTCVGVGFVCVTQDFDLTTPAGKLMSNMLAAFAEFERDILRERVKAGIAAAQKNGTRTGNPVGRPPKARAKADKIVRLFAEGLNKSQIAERLHIGRSSVIRAIQKATAGAGLA